MEIILADAPRRVTLMNSSGTLYPDSMFVDLAIESVVSPGKVECVEDIIPEAYVLEVSSPGLDRLLFEKDHYESCKGSLVKIRLKMNFQGRRNFKGRLAGVEEDEVVLRLDESEEILFPLETIDKAQVIPEFD